MVIAAVTRASNRVKIKLHMLQGEQHREHMELHTCWLWTKRALHAHCAAHGYHTFLSLSLGRGFCCTRCYWLSRSLCPGTQCSALLYFQLASSISTDSCNGREKQSVPSPLTPSCWLAVDNAFPSGSKICPSSSLTVSLQHIQSYFPFPPPLTISLC